MCSRFVFSFVFSFLVASLIFPTTALAGNSVSLISIETYGNFHAGGVIATITGDDNRNASAELHWRQAGESSFRLGHPLSRIDTTHFVGSLFWLDPGTSYEVQVTVSDPDGVGGSPSPVTSLVTRSETLPEPSIRTLYVATSGNDSNPGTNPAAPLRTIQRAATLSQSGDLILISPGVYRESVSVPRAGTASQPIVFRGNGGGVILDGADETIENGVAWSSVGNGVFSRVTGFLTGHVVTNLGRLYKYGSLGDLQALGAGSPGGFFFDGTTLYVKFSSGTSPALHQMYVARFEDGFYLDGLSHVRIENMEIRHFGSGSYGKGVYLRYCSDITVRNCRIHGFESSGIWVKGGDRNLIEDNEIWDTSIFTWPWGYSKGSSAENNGVTFTNEIGRGNVVRRNTIHGTFNGVGPCGSSAPPSGISNETDLYDNLFYEHTDDGFEPEGYCSNVRMWNNFVKDVHMVFAVAPAAPGPTYLLQNVGFRFGNTRTSKQDGYTASALKINSGYSTPIGPLYLYHNTFFTDVPNTDGVALLNPGNSTLITARNNIIAGTRYVLYKVNPVVLDWNWDDFYTTDITRFVYWQGTPYSSLSSFRSGTGQELQGISVQPNFVNPAGGDFRLPAGSALIDAGVFLPGINDDYVGDAPDIGACEYVGEGDTTPPVISSVASSGVTSSGATITWTTNEASDSQVEYGLTTSYGSITTLNTNLVTSHSVGLSGLTANTTYHYRVKSKDAAANSATSSDYTFTTSAPPDTQAPTVPTNLTATAASSTQINLSWTASSDNVGVTGYRIYRDGSQIATTTGTSYQDTGRSPSTTYTYRVAAYDAAGNLSAQSSQASATTQAAPDTQAPSVPKGLKATVISSTQINLSWTAPTDNTGVTGYKIYQNNIQIGTTGNTSYQSTGLNPNTSYTYRVAAYDAAGNTSAKSLGVTVRTQPSPSTMFTMGDRVQTIANATVRSAPSNSGTSSGTQLKGATGSVARSPWYWNLQWWWQIDFDSGVDGWVAQGKLRKVGA